MMKKTLIITGKVGLSAGLMIFALRSTNLFEIWEAVRSADFFFLAAAFLLIAGGFLISALRWQVLLKAHGAVIPLKELVRMYLIGTFFNNFMPTTIGGDIVRTYDVSKKTRSLGQSLAVIVVERLTGVFALICYSFSGLVLGYSKFGNVPMVWYAGGIFFIFLAAAAFLIKNFQGIHLEPSSPSLLEKAKIKIHRILNTFYFYKDHKERLSQAILLAFLLQLNVIVFFFIISCALKISAPFYYFLLIVPLIHVVLMFPVSINGIGVRENAFIFFLAKIGVDSAESIALALISFAMVLAYAVIGGVLYAARR